MVCIRLVYVCFFLIYVRTTFCHTCTAMNFGNSQSVINNINQILKPLNIVPVYNGDSIPDFSKFNKEFQDGKEDDDVNLNITQMVTKYKYPVEQHQVKTSDGYSLNMFRIPNQDGPAAFLMHGVLCSADDFVTPGPDAGLAYSLADAGYDVWLGNHRGNKHSRHHESLSPDCAEFWDFSFDEIGLYDIPSMIDYVLSATKQNKLLYVGHSQGATSFFIMCSEKPEYNEKISLMIALSAVVFVGQVRSPLIQIFSPASSIGEELTKSLGIYELGPRDAFIDALTSLFCGSPETADIICNNILFVAAGFDYPQTNAKRLPVIFSHYPAGGAVKQGLHYGFNVNSKKFRQFDYGMVENIQRYGTPEPPDYPLEKVTCPVAIFYSLNDWITSGVDTYKLLVRLPNVIELYHVPYSMLNHFDYLYAKNSSEIVYEEVKRLLAKYAI